MHLADLCEGFLPGLACLHELDSSLESLCSCVTGSAPFFSRRERLASSSSSASCIFTPPRRKGARFS
jgi:hypothetical protein